MTDPGSPWTTPEPTRFPAPGDDQSYFTDAAEAAEMAGFSVGPPAVESDADHDDAGLPAWEPESTDWRADAGEDVASWDPDSEAPVLVEPSMEIDVASAELAAWDAAFDSMARVAEPEPEPELEPEPEPASGTELEREPEPEPEPASPTEPEREPELEPEPEPTLQEMPDAGEAHASNGARAAALAAAWIPRNTPVVTARAGSVFAAPIATPAPSPDPTDIDDGWLGPEPPDETIEGAIPAPDDLAATRAHELTPSGADDAAGSSDAAEPADGAAEPADAAADPADAAIEPADAAIEPADADAAAEPADSPAESADAAAEPADAAAEPADSPAESAEPADAAVPADAAAEDRTPTATPWEPQTRWEPPTSWDTAESTAETEAANHAAQAWEGSPVQPEVVSEDLAAATDDDDRWWIEPGDAAAEPAAMAAGRPVVAPEGVPGPTPDPEFLAALLGRSEAGRFDAAMVDEERSPDDATAPWKEPGEAVHPQPLANLEEAGSGPSPTQARPEPEPVDSIAASFGAWFPPAPAEERPAAPEPADLRAPAAASAESIRTEQEEASPRSPAPMGSEAASEPLAAAPAAGRSQPGVMERYSTPGPAMRSLSVLSPPPEQAETSDEDVAVTDIRADDTGRSDPEEPTEQGGTSGASLTPEAQLRAQIRQRAAAAAGIAPGAPATSTDLWLLLGEPDAGTRDGSEIRSPTVTIILTVLAVLFVVILVLGFLYMFTSLL